MPLIVPDEGEVAMLDMLVNGDSFANVRLRLYQNNLTPDQDTVYGDFAVATFSGYGEETPSFGAASIVSHKGKIVDSAERTFVHNGGGTSNTIYGYYVVDSVNNLVLWAERFATPQSMSNNGDLIGITLAFTEDSEF